MTSDLFPDTHPSAASDLQEDAFKVARVMALLWSYRTRGMLLNALRLLEYKRADGRAFTVDNIKEWQKVLLERGLLLEHPHGQGYYRLALPLRSVLYQQLLAVFDVAALERLLFALANVRMDYKTTYQWPVYDHAATVAVLRL